MMAALNNKVYLRLSLLHCSCRRQTTVTAHLKSEQLLLFVFALLLVSALRNTAVQGQITEIDY